jgi:hypothetical protein
MARAATAAVDGRKPDFRDFVTMKSPPHSLSRIAAALESGILINAGRAISLTAWVLPSSSESSPPLTTFVRQRGYSEAGRPTAEALTTKFGYHDMNQGQSNPTPGFGVDENGRTKNRGDRSHSPSGKRVSQASEIVVPAGAPDKYEVVKK